MKIKSTNIITILLVGITIALSTGCIAKNREGEHSAGKEKVTPEITICDGITVEPSVLKTSPPLRTEWNKETANSTTVTDDGTKKTDGKGTATPERTRVITPEPDKTQPKPTKTVEVKDKIKFIEEKFGIDLPDSAEVVNFYTKVFALEVITKDPPPHSGIFVGAKIHLSDEDAEKLKTDLANSRYTEREHPSLTLKHEVDWWDLEDKDAKWCFERHCPIEYYSTEDDKENDIRTRYFGGQYISMKEIEGEYNYIYIMG